MEFQTKHSNNTRSKNLLVSFSKRRKGLFHKASELSSKCGAHVAVLVLSPSDNPFAFGHSSVDDVLRRYHSLRSSQPQPAPAAMMSERVKRKATELEELKIRVNKERERGGRFDSIGLISDEDIENSVSIEELESYKATCLNLLSKARESFGFDIPRPFEVNTQNHMSMVVVVDHDDHRVDENYISVWSAVAVRDGGGGGDGSKLPQDIGDDFTVGDQNDISYWFDDSFQH